MAKKDEIRIEYDGDYPNLCRGNLIVYISEERWEFPLYCLESGGRVCRNENWDMWPEEGPWSVSKWPEGFPDDDGLKMLIENIINDEIPLGCCGGCI